MITIISLSLLLRLSLSAADKTQYFFHQGFNSTLPLINGILSDLQKLLKKFNGAAIVALFRIPLSPSASVFPNSLALNLKDLKPLLSVIYILKLLTSSLE